MATRNGIRFIAQQLESIEKQTWPDIDLVISDDGSTDGTREFLDGYHAKWTKGAARMVAGPEDGSASANFRSLILRADADADFVAFADQDDIWLPDKIERAIAALEVAGPGPALHCSRTSLIDATGASIGSSVYFRRAPGFCNALVQSLAGGNTMVMNRSAFELVREASRRSSYISHDWWTYMIVTGAGGRVLYSSLADTLYRQHDDNVVGSNMGFLARMHRVRALLRGRFREWNDGNIAALLAVEDLLTDDSKAVLREFIAARNGPLWHRLGSLKRSRVFRQTAGGHLMLYAACLLRLI